MQLTYTSFAHLTYKKERISAQQLLRTKQITHAMKTVSTLKGHINNTYATSYERSL